MEIEYVFVNRSDEEDIYPPKVSDIAEEQLKDEALQN